MGAEQSSRSTSMNNPNSIEVTEPVFCTTLGDPEPEKNSSKPKRVYAEHETENLTAKMDADYVSWIKEIEKKNEVITRQARDQYIKKADAVHDRFSYVDSKPICESAQKAVMKCYENNKGTTLNCSEEVKYFTDCVREHQLNYKKESFLPKPAKAS